MRTILYNEVLDVQVSLDPAGIFQCQSVPDIDAAIHLAPEIEVFAKDFAFDFSLLAYDDASA